MIAAIILVHGPANFRADIGSQGKAKTGRNSTAIAVTKLIANQSTERATN